MEFYFQSLFGLYVHSCPHWLRPRTPPPPFGLIYEGAIGQPRYRRHLFVTPFFESGLTGSAGAERSGRSTLQRRRARAYRTHARAAQPVLIHPAVRTRGAQALGRLLAALCGGQ
jgi:hypothetical protein